MIKSSVPIMPKLCSTRYYLSNYYSHGSLDVPVALQGFQIRVGIPVQETSVLRDTTNSVAGAIARTPGEVLTQGPLIPNTNVNEVYNEQWIYSLEPETPPEVLTVSEFLALYTQEDAEATTDIPFEMSDSLIYLDRAAKRIDILSLGPVWTLRTHAPWWGDAKCGEAEWQEAAIVWMTKDPVLNGPCLYSVRSVIKYGTSYPGGTRWHVDVYATKMAGWRDYWNDSSYCRHTVTVVDNASMGSRENPKYGGPKAYAWALVEKYYNLYTSGTAHPASLASYKARYNKTMMSFIPTYMEDLTVVNVPSDSAMERIQREFLAIEPTIHPEFTRRERVNAAVKVIENFNHFNSNMSAYAADLPKLGDSVRSLRNLVKDLRNPKAWASAWLSGRYSDRLTIADTRELVEAASQVYENARRHGTDTWRHRISQEGSGQFQNGQYLYEYSYKDYLNLSLVTSSGLLGDCENILASLHRWDLFPTLENLWDLVPFSFVADWCCDVSQLCSQIDASLEADLIDAKAQIIGQRRECTMDLRLFRPDLRGTLTHIVYSRSSQNFLDDISPVGLEFSLPRPINLVDATALGTQTILSLF